jgi:hypothetical protein
MDDTVRRPRVDGLRSNDEWLINFEDFRAFLLTRPAFLLMRFARETHGYTITSRHLLEGARGRGV